MRSKLIGTPYGSTPRMRNGTIISPWLSKSWAIGAAQSRNWKKLDPNLAVAHNQLGFLYLNDARAAEAGRELKTALDIDKKYAKAQDNLGVLYRRKGKDSKALKLFQQAVENDPHDVKFLVNWGLTFARLGNLAEAEKQFQTALQVAPDYEGALTSLACSKPKRATGTRPSDCFKR